LEIAPNPDPEPRRKPLLNCLKTPYYEASSGTKFIRKILNVLVNALLWERISDVCADQPDIFFTLFFWGFWSAPLSPNPRYRHEPLIITKANRYHPKQHGLKNFKVVKA
jgi:hypothetical protein